LSEDVLRRFDGYESGVSVAITPIRSEIEVYTMSEQFSESDDAQDAAVEILQEFGLTEYRAKAFVALTRLGEGTAKEVSQVADIPQARVYDCMEALHERGLVDVRRSKPRLFRAVGIEEALEKLERRYDDRLTRLESNLSRLETPETDDDDPGVWTAEGTESITDRMRRIADEADDEVWIALPEATLATEGLLSSLSAATDRGVAVTVGSPDGAVRDAVSEAVPNGSVVETWTWWDELPVAAGEVSAVILADGDATLVAVAEGVGTRQHRAVWAADDDSALVSVLRPILAQAIQGRRWPPGD
jgi:sugar-specific transcriptional regulator TrmB